MTPSYRSPVPPDVRRYIASFLPSGEAGYGYEQLGVSAEDLIEELQDLGVDVGELIAKLRQDRTIQRTLAYRVIEMLYMSGHPWSITRYEETALNLPRFDANLERALAKLGFRLAWAPYGDGSSRGYFDVRLPHPDGEIEIASEKPDLDEDTYWNVESANDLRFYRELQEANDVYIRHASMTKPSRRRSSEIHPYGCPVDEE